MPKWGIEMSEGVVAEWMIGEGQDFAKGDVLALIETDKITNEVEAESDGRFVRILARAGETHPVGALLAVFGAAGDEAAADALIASFRPADTSFGNDSEEQASSPPSTATTPVPPLTVEASIPDHVRISPAAFGKATRERLDVTTLTGTGRGGRIMLIDVDQALSPAGAPALKGAFQPSAGGMAFASPMARRLAARLGVALDDLDGTGPRGRISKADVLAAAGRDSAASQPASADVEILAMSPMRKAIARRLTEAKQQIPHFYLRRRVRADRLLAHRTASVAPRPSVNDYLIRAVAVALCEVPAVNIQVHGSDIHRFAAADIAIAVATDKGLLTPILRGADRLALGEIASATADLAGRARASRLRQEDIEGGSFTISNLGPYGIEQFDAIINPPQGAILAVGAARPEPVDDDGAIRIVPVLHLSLSCDHRAIDGADGARFLAALADLLEHPERL